MSDTRRSFEVFREAFGGSHERVMHPDAYRRAKDAGDLPDILVSGATAYDEEMPPELEALINFTPEECGITEEEAARIREEEDLFYGDEPIC